MPILYNINRTKGTFMIPSGATKSPTQAFSNTKSLQFDGVDEYVNTTLDLSAQSFTVSFWFNPNFSKAIVQKLFLKRVFCDWSAEDTTNHLLNIINMDEIGVTPWQLLSLEDSPQNEYLRAHKYAKKFHNQYRKKTN